MRPAFGITQIPEKKEKRKNLAEALVKVKLLGCGDRVTLEEVEGAGADFLRPVRLVRAGRVPKQQWWK